MKTLDPRKERVMNGTEYDNQQEATREQAAAPPPASTAPAPKISTGM